MTFVWWCAAGVLTIISAALYRREVAILRAANPATRLPWIGWPASTPRSARLLGLFAMLPLIIVADCVVEALGRRQPYDALWALPFGLIVLAVTAVPQARHNRRVRSTA